MDEVQTLVTRAQAGDLDAYALLIARFQQMAYGYAYAFLGDFHLAEDAAQEAFLEAYRMLERLREPAAFAGWFRRIVFKHCDRLTRGKRIPTRPLEAAQEVPTRAPGPAELAERRETRDRMLAAVRALPEREREVTALFYINGYSHRDIARFLEVPETTVNSRLHSARERLREEVMTMVADELKSHALPPEFSHEVRSLLERPRPLEIEGHPVREVWAAIRAALPDYEVVAGEEVVERDDLLPAFADRAYQVGDSKALRTEMTMVTMAAMRGRTPPVRLLAAGRVFRPDAEDAWHSPVFHQVDALCIEPGAGVERLKAVLTDVLTAVLGELELRWTGHEYGIVDEGMAPAIRHGADWLEVAGCGLLKGEDLRAAGHDPGAVQGFAFGMGVERLAMLKHGIEDIRQLWEPPYVPE